MSDEQRDIDPEGVRRSGHSEEPEVEGHMVRYEPEGVRRAGREAEPESDEEGRYV
jgi:hypothetical protein